MSRAVSNVPTTATLNASLTARTSQKTDVIAQKGGLDSAALSSPEWHPYHVAQPRYLVPPVAALQRAAGDDVCHRQGRPRERARPLSKPSRPTLSRRQRRG